mmetsp:Transcript_10604/g.19880  ORF Transcript_10604/g.19880 Transcript_10604/m.19880 type:complete len:310 (+) Transcript_10604:60-989(+)
MAMLGAARVIVSALAVSYFVGAQNASFNYSVKQLSSNTSLAARKVLDAPGDLTVECLQCKLDLAKCLLPLRTEINDTLLEELLEAHEGGMNRCSLIKNLIKRAACQGHNGTLLKEANKQVENCDFHCGSVCPGWGQHGDKSHFAMPIGNVTGSHAYLNRSNSSRASGQANGGSRSALGTASGHVAGPPTANVSVLSSTELMDLVAAEKGQVKESVCDVDVWEHSSFRGEKGKGPCGTNWVGHSWNDRISSIRFTNDGRRNERCVLTLYEDSNHRGRSWTMEAYGGKAVEASNLGWWNDRISSWSMYCVL